MREVLIGLIPVLLTWSWRIHHDAVRHSYTAGWARGATMSPAQQVFVGKRVMMVSSVSLSMKLNEPDTGIIELVDPLRYLVRVSADAQVEFETTAEELRRVT